MTKRLIAICFLYSLSVTFCSECTEKINLNSEELEYVCGNIILERKICAPDYDGKKCVEKECSDIDSWTHPCESINFYDESISAEMKCIPKIDNSGCELEYCENLSSNCDRILLNDNERCVLNEEKNHCEVKKCSDLKNNCDEFVPYDPGYKCILNDELGQCEIISTGCEELTSNNCDEYHYFSYDKCILDTTTNKCKHYTCEKLSSSECDKYGFYDDDKVCAPKGNKCQLQECSELSKDVCETVKFGDPGRKCVLSVENKCTLSTCDQLLSNCEQFIPSNPVFKCIYNDDPFHRCTIEEKECEELSEDQCDLFNVEHGITINKCVKKDGKCVLNSRKLEISGLILLLLLFLF